MHDYGLTVICGMVVGTLARLVLLRVDYRNYPTYPHAYMTHLAHGFIAAALGAVAVPALAKPDFTAVTFLALAAQQFREIRGMERASLAEIESEDLVPRGVDYIEGIAKVFEARNYLIIGTALAVSTATFFLGWPAGLVTGGVALLIDIRLMRGHRIEDIAEVIPAKLQFRGPFLYVNDIVITNVGLPQFREKILKEGLGVLLKPKDDDARLTLHDPGQRQAIIHTAAAVLGTKNEIGEPEFMPLARKNIDTGEVGIFILPNEPDMDSLIMTIRGVPVLESSRRRALSSKAGRLAAD